MFVTVTSSVLLCQVLLKRTIICILKRRHKGAVIVLKFVISRLIVEIRDKKGNVSAKEDNRQNVWQSFIKLLGSELQKVSFFYFLPALRRYHRNWTFVSDEENNAPVNENWMILAWSYRTNSIIINGKELKEIVKIKTILTDIKDSNNIET